MNYFAPNLFNILIKNSRLLSSYPFEDLIDYYTDTTKRTLTDDDYENIFRDKDKKFNKWFDKIKPFLHPQFGGDNYSKRFGSIKM